MNFYAHTADFVAIQSSRRFDAGKLSRYLDGTSLLFVSTTERGAASLQAALAFFPGLAEREASASRSAKKPQFTNPLTDANGTFHKPPNWI